MKETLSTRHSSTIEPMTIAKNKKATLQAIHTNAVNHTVNGQERNVVLDDCPSFINTSENDLIRKERTTLAQLRSGHCTRAESRRMLASTSAPIHHIMLSISSIARLIQRHWHRLIYGANQWTATQLSRGGCRTFWPRTFWPLFWGRTFWPGFFVLVKVKSQSLNMIKL